MIRRGGEEPEEARGPVNNQSSTSNNSISQTAATFTYFHGLTARQRSRMRSVKSPGKIFNVEDGMEELRSSGDRVSFLKSDLDRARRQVSVLQEKLMKLMGSQEKAEFLANSNTELTTLLVGAEAKCSELTEKNKVAEEKCAKLDLSLRNTQEQLENTRSKNSELDVRVKEMDTLVGELKTAEERSRLLEAENSKAQAERLDAEVALEKERTKVLEERDTQQKQLKQANDHRDTEVEMRLNTEALCTELEGRLEAITRDHDRLTRDHAEAKSEIEMLAGRNAQLVNQNQELMAANAEAHRHALAQDAQNTELEENLSALVAQYEKLEELRLQWERDAKRAQAKMEDLKAECYTLDGRVGVLSDENKAMDDEIHAKAAKCEAVEAMYRTLELKYVECEGSVGELRRTSKSVQALEVSSATLEARALNAESKVDALERHLQQTQAQSSVVQAQYDGELQRRTEAMPLPTTSTLLLAALVQSCLPGCVRINSSDSVPAEHARRIK
ncbi:hypothetical protein CYMTET_20648 [Cymbomonas tetramitiformis]|uniref:Uncharacterized protein n=1 Tax=Cymbomonas tetramitiformis TaxID=36881 RepID=A0AAE0L420_9CHLO|nr:hypothetical protein CYMTET_20648 [Cymbomonas tetramitiformis]